jgi:hypothetical protein
MNMQDIDTDAFTRSFLEELAKSRGKACKVMIPFDPVPLSEWVEQRLKEHSIEICNNDRLHVHKEEDFPEIFARFPRMTVMMHIISKKARSLFGSTI